MTGKYNLVSLKQFDLSINETITSYRLLYVL